MHGFEHSTIISLLKHDPILGFLFAPFSTARQRTPTHQRNHGAETIIQAAAQAVVFIKGKKCLDYKGFRF